MSAAIMHTKDSYQRSPASVNHRVSLLALATMFYLLLLTCSTRGEVLQLKSKELSAIAQRIYANECDSDPDKLLWWNRGESFPSLGIGHFIWYPQSVDGPFQQSFPALIEFMKARKVALPEVLRRQPLHSPWSTREEFIRQSNSADYLRLKLFLQQTMTLQAEFIYRRAQLSFDKIYAAAPSERRELSDKIELLLAQPGGAYALIDYVNFKGEGLLASERYRGQGWGLYQVLQEMKGPAEFNGANGDSDDKHDKSPLAEFQRAAKVVLRRRADNAERDIERERWLPGWERRLDTYVSQPKI